MLRSVVAAAAEEKVLVAGISRDSVAGTLELAESAAEFGYDAVLVKRPSVLREKGRRRSCLHTFRRWLTVRRFLWCCTAPSLGKVLCCPRTW